MPSMSKLWPTRLLNLQVITLIIQKSKNSVSKCISTAWDFQPSHLVTEIDHTTMINWVKESAQQLSDEPQDDEIPEITEIDEIQRFVGNKKQIVWNSLCG